MPVSSEVSGGLDMASSSASGVQEGDDRVSVCRHWKKLGYCLFADKCHFVHPPELATNDDLVGDMSSLSVGDRRRKAYAETYGAYVEVNNGVAGGGYSTDNCASTRRCVRNRNKVGGFRRFLIDRFSVEYLRGTGSVVREGGTSSYAGVLDVAGGKGELSFELVNLNAIPCTGVDPRPFNLGRARKRLRMGIDKRSVVLKDYVDVSDGDVVPITPRQFRFYFLPALWNMAGLGEGAVSEAERQPLVDAAFQTACDTEWTVKGLVSESTEDKRDSKRTVKGPTSYGTDPTTGTTMMYNCSNAPELNEDYYTATCPDWREIRSVLTECTVVVGLHPDQAAGDIIAFALEFDKSFALIPCCTYFKTFPKRKLKNGMQVKSYDSLVQFLVEMVDRYNETVTDPSKKREVHVDTLDFAGKNRVVWSRATDFKAQS
eukprot:TRINITY_DN623_c0_g2_i1.p1 TRINITY_DN623_c0_g2~~TRINITY_DN623_c0_g2_i1.p1  ORF type:complete len:430 (+),score=52.83 TRINITY_DN623_c0_g2_i1:146-1435(+)